MIKFFTSRFSSWGLALLVVSAAMPALNAQDEAQPEAPQPVATPSSALGIWLMVNASAAYEIKPDNRAEILGTGIELGVRFFDNGQFVMGNEQITVQGLINGDTLIILNPDSGAAPWARQLLLRKSSAEEAQMVRGWFNEMRGRARANAALSDTGLIRSQLQRLYLAAQEYFTQTGASEAQISDLVGEGKLIARLPSIAGEDYSGLVFRPGLKDYSVTTAEGNLVRFSAE